MNFIKRNLPVIFPLGVFVFGVICQIAGVITPANAEYSFFKGQMIAAGLMFAVVQPVVTMLIVLYRSKYKQSAWLTG